ncbi:hypothetical protein NWE55_14780 [Myroides albus]|uniref:hypothetical protein n=1 Tax=Myroides albus TaxID=2562892 RepID=UPI002158DC1C|nr:hypothetical protein [Myroides albus]UVD79375.1 hypothetical protein NWE55_14780 [Myroides albus]
MNDSNYIHKIKVPIFSSEIKDRTEGGLFEFNNYNSLIDYIKSKIDKFNESKKVVTQSKSSKVKEMQISKIEYFDSEFEKVPTLLLKVTAYNTNLLDGFVEIDEKKELKSTDKVGSDTNFMLIYPCIFGPSTDKFSYQFKFFVYDDPTKDSHEIISICKLVSNKILDIKIRNLKLDNILKELHEDKILENVEIHLSSQYEEADDPDIKMKKYLVKSKVSKITKNNYKDIPSEKFENLLNQTDGSFIRRTFKLVKNKREIKITQEYKSDLNKLSNSIEEIFNSQYELNQEDLKNIFEKGFVLKNLELALRDFYKQNQ